MFVLTSVLIPALYVGSPQPFLSAERQPAAQQEEGFQKAQRNIEEAIANLDAYIRQSADGKYATLAAGQLAALTNLKLSSTPPEPVYLANFNQKVQWYIQKIERTKDSTLVTFKIINLSPDQDCQFRAFNASPLVIVGDDREIYMMTKRPIKLPNAVRTTTHNIVGGATNDQFWVFQGGRTLTIEVEFERLPDSVLSGRVQYLSPVAGVVPAKFSLANEQQKPKN
jgi:hypothetical protein